MGGGGGYVGEGGGDTGGESYQSHVLDSTADAPGFGQVPLQLEHLHISCLIILTILCEVGGWDPSYYCTP